MEYFDLPNNQVGALTTRLAGDASMVQGVSSYFLLAAVCPLQIKSPLHGDVWLLGPCQTARSRKIEQMFEIG